MSLATEFERYLRLAEDHPAATVIAAYDRDIVFAVTDDAEFVLRIRAGRIRLAAGARIDWRGADWRTASCISAGAATLRAIAAGEMLFTEAFSRNLLGWGSRGLADERTAARSTYRWLAGVFRLASEQCDVVARRAYVAALAEAG